jgi:hypothetical protein
MNKAVRIYFPPLAFLLLGACASPAVIQSVKPEDASLGCEQLRSELADAERFRAEAANEKSLTRGNVVRAILFWPAVLGTAENANEAIAAAEARKVHLANQMAIRKCGVTTSVKIGTSPDSKSASIGQDESPTEDGVGASKEARLEELKRLFYMKYLSKEAYSEMKKGILESP